jgi:hypothetical protein
MTSPDLAAGRGVVGKICFARDSSHRWSVYFLALQLGKPNCLECDVARLVDTLPLV